MRIKVNLNLFGVRLTAGSNKMWGVTTELRRRLCISRTRLNQIIVISDDSSSTMLLGKVRNLIAFAAVLFKFRLCAFAAFMRLISENDTMFSRRDLATHCVCARCSGLYSGRSILEDRLQMTSGVTGIFM